MLKMAYKQQKSPKISSNFHQNVKTLISDRENSISKYEIATKLPKFEIFHEFRSKIDKFTSKYRIHSNFYFFKLTV